MAATSGAIRAGQAFVELFADDSRLVKGLRAAQARLSAWGAFVTRIGTQVFAAGSSVLGAFAGSAAVFSQVGDEIEKFATRTGLTAEQVSGLKHACELSDASLSELEAGIRQLSKRIDGGDKVLKEYGLSFERLRKMSPEQQLHEIADLIANTTDPTQRAAAAMDLLGKSGTSLIPLLAGGSNGLREMQAEATRLGLVMTTAEATSAAAFNDALGTLWSQLKAITVQIGSAVAPLLTDLLKRSQPVIANTIAWVRANRPLLANLFAIAAAVAGVGGALLGTGAALKATAWSIGPLIGGFRMLAGGVNLAIRGGALLAKILGAAVIPMLRTAVSAVVALGQAAFAALAKGLAAGASAAAAGIASLLTPIGVVGIAVAGLAAYVIYASDVFGDLLDAGSRCWSGLKSTALAAWSAIGEALARGDLAAAAKVAWAALQLEWTRGTGELMTVWGNFTTFVQKVFATASTNLAKFFATAFTEAKRVISQFQEWAIDIVGEAAKAIYAIEELVTGKSTSKLQMAVDIATAVLKAKVITERKKLDEQLEAQHADIDRQGQVKVDDIDTNNAAAIAAREAALQQATEEFAAAAAAARDSAQAPTDDQVAQRRRIFEADADTKKLHQQGPGGTFSSLASLMFGDGTEGDAAKETAKNTRESVQYLRQLARMRMGITYFS